MGSSALESLEERVFLIVLHAFKTCYCQVTALLRMSMRAAAALAVASG